jgi:SAM-dependent methyltransferase
MDYERLYDYRFRGVDQAAREGVWEELAPYITERALASPERLLDPAAGRREFITAAPADERWAVDAVDYGEAVDGAGVRVIVADIMSADLPADHFDGVFVSNFLEHLAGPEGVQRFLRKMLAVIEPGGRIAIMGPNFRYCAAEYFDCADHTVALTHVAVGEHLHAAGFEVASITPRFLPYSFRGRLPPSPALTRAYLRFRPAWRLLGKQFLIVGTRPR